MPKTLLLAGGGHAHMTTLANLDKFVSRGYKVTVIQPSPFHYYSGMGPGMLGGTYTPEEIRFATRHVVEKKGGTFILGKVVRVAPETRTVFLESGEEITYDIVSFNVGSHVPEKIIAEKSDTIFTVKPIERLQEAQEKIREIAAEKPVRIGIIGGGASAVEIAGNIWGLTRKLNLYPAEIRIFARSTLMAGYPEPIRSRAVHTFAQRGIEIFEYSDVTQVSSGKIYLASSLAYEPDIIFLAVGVKPSPIFSNSGLSVGPEGGMVVNQYLQCINHSAIFGGGDCIYFRDQPLDKVGVFAVRENPVLLHNLMAALEGKELIPFNPGGDYLLIFNLGGGEGILRKKFLLFGGRTAFMLKDYIDRKFMKKFQAIE